MELPAPPLSDIVALWSEILVTAAACLALIVDIFIRPRQEHLIGRAALGVSVLVLVLMLGIAAVGTTVFSGMFFADSYTTFFRALCLIATALTVLISLRYLDDEASQQGEYYALLLFATVGMMMMAGG